MKFPAKYTQLPNYDYEYITIVSKTWNGINKKEFENMVAEVKKSSFKNKYKHRTHLENIGLICTKANSVYLTSIGEDIKSNKISLSNGLKTLVLENNELLKILKEIQLVGYFNNNIQKKKLCEILHHQIYNETPVATISRYIVPIISLFNIAKVVNYNIIDSSIYDPKRELREQNMKVFNYENILEDIDKIYIKIAGEYGKVIAIEKIESLLKMEYCYNKDKIQQGWKYIYDNIDLRYKYNLVTLPFWGTKYKRIIINGQSFTHIIINYREVK